MSLGTAEEMHLLFHCKLLVAFPYDKSVTSKRFLAEIRMSWEDVTLDIT